MHRHYDPRLFDVLSEVDMRREYAPQRSEGLQVDREKARALRADGKVVEGVDAMTPLELLEAGVDVRYRDPPCEGEGGDSGVAEAVERGVFGQWLELAEMRLGSQVGQWWSRWVSWKPRGRWRSQYAWPTRRRVGRAAGWPWFNS